MPGLLGLLVSSAMLAGPAYAQPAATEASDAPADVSARDWRGTESRTPLDDGSTLNEYVGETTALQAEAARLQVAFSPRFGCAPSARLLLDPPLAARLDTTLDALEVSIDGTALVWPAVHDALGPRRVVSHVGSERERKTLRLQLDVGDRITVTLDGSTSLAFSLLGSRAMSAAMETACRAHVPEPIDDAG